MQTSSQEGYYEATFSVEDAKVQGVSGSTDVATFLAGNAQQVKVILSYPLEAPIANRKTLVFSLFRPVRKIIDNVKLQPGLERLSGRVQHP